MTKLEVFENGRVVGRETVAVETSSVAWTLTSTFVDTRVESTGYYQLRVDPVTLEVQSIQGDLEIAGEKRSYSVRRDGAYLEARFSPGVARRIPFGTGTFLETSLPSSTYFAARRIPFSKARRAASTRTLVVDELRARVSVVLDERHWVPSAGGLGACVAKRKFSSHLPVSILCFGPEGDIASIEEGARQWRIRD